MGISSFRRSFSASGFFFFNDTATTEIYTLSLHDALPISNLERNPQSNLLGGRRGISLWFARYRDRKSTRLNSSHLVISYAVFCLKKKKNFFNASSTPLHTTDARRPACVPPVSVCVTFSRR